jgi:hypothetical protein
MDINIEEELILEEEARVVDTIQGKDVCCQF